MHGKIETIQQKFLFMINDGPYGTERAYNALRLALNLGKRPEAAVRVFLLGEGVACARKGQKTPDGFYNIERMLKSVAKHGEVATCGTCCEARGIGPEDLAEGVQMSSLDQQGEWTLEADKVLIY